MIAPSFLIVRLSAIGDCVMAAYAVTAIRNRHPDAKIVWAVETRCSAVVDDQRLATAKAEFSRDKWKKARFRPEYWREQFGLYRDLRRQKFDYGIDLQGHGKTAILMTFARPKRKISTQATDVFAKCVLPVLPGWDPKVHTIKRAMDVVRHFGDFELPDKAMMPDLTDTIRSVREDLGHPKSLVTITAAAGQMDKAFPIETAEKVTATLIAEGHQVLFIGGPNDPRSQVPGVIDRVGKYSLRETMSAIAASQLVICGDTGAGHLGGAYGVPVISVFGPSDPDRFRPYPPTNTVFRRGRSADNIEADEVIESAREVLSRGPLSD